jgi:hypothetical protein
MSVTRPIVVDLGKVRNEHLDALSAGSGPLVAEIEEVTRLVCSHPDLDVPKRIFLPVVVVYDRA